MALIFKSNNKYTGGLVLKSVVDVTQTAQEFYDEYAAWVTADGGEIINPTATLNAITWAKKLGVLGKSHAISASWGIKKDASGKVLKVYGFNFDVFAFNSTAGTFVNSGAFPVIKFATNNRLEQQIKRRNVTSQKFTVGLSVKQVSASQYFGTAVADGYDTGKSDCYTLAYAPNINGYNSFNMPDTNNAYIVAKSATAATTSNVGFSAYCDNVGDMITTFSDGVRSLSFLPTTNHKWKDIHMALESKLVIGQILSAGTYNGSPINAEFAEYWLINDTSEDITRSLSERLNTLY